MRIGGFCLMATALLAGVPGGVVAQTPITASNGASASAATAAATAAARDPAVLVKQISDQFTKLDPAQRKELLPAIEEAWTLAPTTTTVYLRGTWLRYLLEAKLFEEADRLALRGIQAFPHDTSGVEAYAAVHARALLGMNRPEEALSAARAAYNVSTMSGTGSAILLIAECLNATHPGDAAPAAAFKTEQLAGAAVAEGGTASQPAARTSKTLLAIPLTDAGYRAAAGRIFGEDFTSLQARGNLLLLANDLAGARAVFERAYGVAPESQLATATENLARCMKAEDGTIGRANAWVLSLRPAGRKERP